MSAENPYKKPSDQLVHTPEHEEDISKKTIEISADTVDKPLASGDQIAIRGGTANYLPDSSDIEIMAEINVFPHAENRDEVPRLAIVRNTGDNPFPGTIIALTTRNPEYTGDKRMIEGTLHPNPKDGTIGRSTFIKEGSKPAEYWAGVSRKHIKFDIADDGFGAIVEEISTNGSFLYTAEELKGLDDDDKTEPGLITGVPESLLQGVVEVADVELMSDVERSKLEDELSRIQEQLQSDPELGEIHRAQTMYDQLKREEQITYAEQRSGKLSDQETANITSGLKENMGDQLKTIHAKPQAAQDRYRDLVSRQREIRNLLG